MTKQELRDKYPQITCAIDIKEGWIPLVDDACKELVSESINFEITCIKEKFGGLRMYTDQNNISGEKKSKIWDICLKYENKSLVVCDVCSKPGMLRLGGWIRTLCNAHSEGKRPSIIKMAKDHICNRSWGTCPECKQQLCSACCLACYSCVDAYRHASCAKKHHEETKHDGNINDLVYHIASVEFASEANLLYGPF